VSPKNVVALAACVLVLVVAYAIATRPCQTSSLDLFGQIKVSLGGCNGGETPIPPPNPPAASVNPVICKDSDDVRPHPPAVFDRGYQDKCAEYVYINDDNICDYCRTVGDRNSLKCTLGTPTGLNGLESSVVALTGGAPYPDTCSWIDYQRKKIPALRGEIGDHHEWISFTPVKMSADGREIIIGPTERSPKTR